MLIKVKVFPAAKKCNVVKKSKDGFDVWVKAKPFQGRANAEARELLADFLNVDIKNIKIVKGSKNRNKIFEIIIKGVV